MELDVTHSFKKKTPSKEVMDERHKKGLCFECGLPGHQAKSHKNKGKFDKKRQLNATGRGGYNAKKKEIYVLQVLSEEELENQNIGTQIVRSFDREFDVSNETPKESEIGEESEAEELVFKAQGRQLITEWPSNWPEKGEEWIVYKRHLYDNSTGFRKWMNLAITKTWQEPGKAKARGPEKTTIWKVVYQDHYRIGWRQVEGTRTYMCHIPGPSMAQTIPKEGQLWLLLIHGTRDRF
jgi:hypothetical protein